MRRSGKKWRHIYPYICAGCGKRRLAFTFTRAARKQCRVCEPEVVSPDQLPLGIPSSP